MRREHYLTPYILKASDAGDDISPPHVSLYVCMSAGNSEMLVFISVFFNSTLKDN